MRRPSRFMPGPGTPRTAAGWPNAPLSAFMSAASGPSLAWLGWSIDGHRLMLPGGRVSGAAVVPGADVERLSAPENVPPVAPFSPPSM